MKPVEQFPEVQQLQVNLEDLYWDTVIARDSLQSDLVSDGDLNTIRMKLPSACENVTSVCTRGKLQRDVGHMTIRVVKSTVGTNHPDHIKINVGLFTCVVNRHTARHSCRTSTFVFSLTAADAQAPGSRILPDWRSPGHEATACARTSCCIRCENKVAQLPC